MTAVAFPALPLLSTHRSPNPVRFAALCGSRDLLAIVHASWDVSICRIISGQTVFTVKRHDECEVSCVEWRFDGALLAVGWSDGSYALHDGERGTVVSTGRIEAQKTQVESSRNALLNRPKDNWRLDLKPDFGPDDDEDGLSQSVCHIGWAKHISSSTISQSRRLPGTSKFDNGHVDEGTTRSLDSLTGAVTSLDATTVLPQLSPIPAHGIPLAKAGPTGNRFASTVAVASVFERSNDDTSGSVNAMIVCQDDGTAQVLLDEAVKIGSCGVGGKAYLHATHPQSSYHAVLSQENEYEMYVSFIHLPLAILGGPLLHIIATNTKRLQNITDYVLHSLRCIEHDYTTGLQFPKRLLNSLSEMLSENNESDARLNLFHLAMTGEFNAPMLEWLTDIVKDTNHKRWTTAVTTMYESIQHHLFINLLPALERLTIASSELRGQAAFHEGSSKFDCAPELFSNILDTVNCLRIVTEKCLSVVTTEHRQFRAFSRWLRMQVEIGIAEPGSASALETEEREAPSIEYPSVLKYIKSTMSQSALQPFVTPRTELQQAFRKEAFFTHPVTTETKYADLIATMGGENTRDLRSSSNMPKNVNSASDLQNLPTIGAILQANVRVALSKITAWQSRMLEKPTTITFPLEQELSPMDLKLLPPQSDSTGARTPAVAKLLAIPKDDVYEGSRLEVIDFRLTAPAEDKTRPAPTARYSLPRAPPLEPSYTPDSWSLTEGGQILDAKFVPSRSDAVLCLVRQEEERRSCLVQFTEGEAETIHHFPDENGFLPRKVIVGGREKHMVCIVVGSRGREWVVLDLKVPSTK